MIESDIYLFAPDYLLELAPNIDQKTVWHFDEKKFGPAVETLRNAGISQSNIDVLSKEAFRDGDQVQVVVSLDILLGIGEQARARLYSALSKNPANRFYAEPLHVTGDVTKWLRDTRLNGEQRDVFQKLLWKRGNAILFSDAPALIELAKSGDEVHEVKRVMSRVRAVFAWIVTPKEESEKAIAYWGADFEYGRIIPLLKAFFDNDSLGPLNVAFLLPRLARRRLYTYPAVQDGVGGRFPDCNWTSLNFFSEEPQPYYIDSVSSLLELRDNYDAIASPSKLGDLIIFLNQQKQVVHSCVYIASDLVFTKNGVSLFAPWILMRTGDVMDCYNAEGESTVLYLRHKRP